MTRMKLALVLIALLVFVSISLAASVQKSFTVVVDRTIPKLTTNMSEFSINGDKVKMYYVSLQGSEVSHDCIGGNCVIIYDFSDLCNDINNLSPINVTITGQDALFKNKIIKDSTDLLHAEQYVEEASGDDLTNRIEVQYSCQEKYSGFLVVLLTSESGGSICFTANDLAGNSVERCIDLNFKEEYVTLNLGDVPDYTPGTQAGGWQDPRAAWISRDLNPLPFGAWDKPLLKADFDESHIGGSDESVFWFMAEHVDYGLDGKYTGTSTYCASNDGSDVHSWTPDTRTSYPRIYFFDDAIFSRVGAGEGSDFCTTGKFNFKDSGYIKWAFVKLPATEMTLRWLAINPSLKTIIYSYASGYTWSGCFTCINYNVPLDHQSDDTFVFKPLAPSVQDCSHTSC